MTLSNYLNLISALERKAEHEMTELQRKSFVQLAVKYGPPKATEALLFFLPHQKPNKEFPLARELERLIRKDMDIEVCN